VSLVERVQETVDREEAAKLEQSLRTKSFTLEDFLAQLQQVKKLGPLDQLLGMLPGVNPGMLGTQLDDRALGHVEAMVRSMTRQERVHPEIINGSRRRRIATGSGRSVQELNRLLKQFDLMRKMLTRHRPGSPAAGRAAAAQFRHVGRRRTRLF